MRNIILIFLFSVFFLIGCEEVGENAELFNAVRNGDIDELNLLITDDTDLTMTNELGNTLLHLAVSTGDLEIVKYFIDAGADPDAENAEGNSPIDLALAEGYADMAIAMKQSTKTVKSSTGSDVTIWNAALRGDMDSMRELLADGSDVNEEDDIDLSTPLHYAAKGGSVSMVTFLLDEGANVYAQDRAWSIPLHEAIMSEHLEIVKVLIEDEKYTMNTADKQGKMAIHCAALTGNMDIITYLVEEKKANVNAWDWLGRTPIHYAVDSKNLKAVKYLIEKGAKTSISDEDGNNLLLRAAENNILEIVKYLIDELGFSVYKENYNEETALTLSCRNSSSNPFGSLEVAKYLIQSGATVNHKDVYGRSALYWAAYCNQYGLVQYLVEQGANIYARTEDGTSIVNISEEKGAYLIMNYILDKQAEDVSSS